ncbi:MAG: hypothetical protein ABS52_05075 [Gemmatimonadetes bacterium SCN 70-22]|nr:MAG: hypothetical protein ABS52_05075 [Gemmatimonadetes bacterium SCN 70-22]
MDTLQKATAIVAIAFGLATVAAGGRVLAGGDPGYVVYLPLLVFNTVMGVAYIGAGVAAWRNARRGRSAAGAIALLNFLVLLFIVYQYQRGSAVAVDSVRAMTFRTAVWLVLLAAMTLVLRRSRAA